MYTDNLTIKIKTYKTAELQKVLTQTILIVSIICIVVGALGIAAYISVSTFFNPTPKWARAFLALAIPFAVGLVFLLTVRSLRKQASTTRDSSEIEFFADCVCVKEFHDDELFSEKRYGYAQFTKKKFIKQYLILYTGNIKIPVFFGGLPQNESDAITCLLGLKQCADMLKINTFSAAVASAVVGTATDEDKKEETV